MEGESMKRNVCRYSRSSARIPGGAFSRYAAHACVCCVSDYIVQLDDSFLKSHAFFCNSGCEGEVGTTAISATR